MGLPKTVPTIVSELQLSTIAPADKIVQPGKTNASTASCLIIALLIVLERKKKQRLEKKLVKDGLQSQISTDF